MWVTTPLGLAVSPVSFTIPAIPPTPLDPSKITLSAIVNGQVTLYGGVGSVSLRDTVIVTNTRTGAQVSLPPNPDGSFSATLTAQIGDNFSLTTRNATGSSPTIQVAVMYLTITAPTAGAILSSDRVLVSGTVQAPSNTGVTVNGVAAAVMGTQFIVTATLVSGNNTITAVATAQNGATVSRNITVATTIMVPPPVQVDASPQSGVAPLLVAFTVTNGTGQPLQRIEADYDGNGTVDFTTINSTVPIEHTYQTPGIYLAKITVIDSLNVSYVETLAIVVNDATQMAQQFTAIWNGMNNALLQGNISAAASYLNASASVKYRPVFETLLSRMPGIITSYSALQCVSITENTGECAVNRTINGKNKIFLIYFLQDIDGVWRLDAM